MILGIFLCFLPLAVFTLIFIFGFKMNVVHILIAILAGLISVLPISLIQYFVPDFSLFANSYPVLYSLLKSLILYAFVEEAIKISVAFILPHKNYEIKNFMFLGFIMGLSVGCFESAVYFFEHLQSARSIGAELMYFQICIRIFTSVIIHFSCAGLGALFVYECREKRFFLSLLILIILIHGVYDFFAGFQNYLKLFAFAVVLFSLIECRIKYSNFAKNS